MEGLSTHRDRYFAFRIEGMNGGGTSLVFCIVLDNKTEIHKINQEVKKGQRLCLQLCFFTALI